MNLVFKVVRAKNGGLYSANRQVLPDFRVQYIPNTWVSARVGKMFAFRTFEALTHMSFSIAENGEVWLAEADTALALSAALTLSADTAAAIRSALLLIAVWLAGAFAVYTGAERARATIEYASATIGVRPTRKG